MATACSSAPQDGGNSPMAKYRTSANADVSVTEDKVPNYKPRWSAVLWFPIKPSAPSTFAVPAPTGPFKGGPYEIPAGAAKLLFGTPANVVQNTTNDTFTGGYSITITVRAK